MRLPLRTTLIFLLLAGSLFSQEKGGTFTGCATDELMHANPTLLNAQKGLNEEKYAQAMSKGKPKGGNLKSLEVIPVVVHIIHIGGAENISNAQVVTAINDFNIRFAESSDNQIQFCLAQRDPNGNATTGITRNTSMLTTETMEVDDIALKDLNRWPPTCYLNIWIVREILSASMGSGVVGYAYMPSAHGLPMDGIVIEADYFGSSYDNDAIGVHEIGHYLGLYHTFEGGCNNSNCLLNGDQVCDTPPDQTTFGSCNPAPNSCNTDADDPSPNNPFTIDVADLTDDYMDYSDPSCYAQFTTGQYERMHYFLTTTRESLLHCMSCLPPCTMLPITAAITSPATTMTITTGTTVNFAGTVTNATSYEWYIVPNMVLSNTLSFSNTFNTAGSYWMKFRAASSDPDFCLDGMDSVLIVVQEPAVASCFGSLLFDQANNISVDLPLSNQYYTGNNGGYTWECWFRLNDPIDQDVRPLISSVDAVVFEDMWLGFGWQGGWFNEPTNRLVFKVDGPNSTVPSGPNCSYEPSGGFQIGTWYHAAGVMDYTAQQAQLYVNGQLVDTKPVTTPPITRNIPTELSYNWSGTPLSFRGNMDEVRIWDRARTAAEIAAYYNQCVDEADPNLFVYYHCNQSAGSTVIDATANNNNGTFSVNEGWSTEEPAYVGTSCIASCIEICGNGMDDNNDGQIDENCGCASVSVSGDTTICPGGAAQLQATSGQSSYSWTPVTGLSDPTIPNPVATPTVTTDYMITVADPGPELVVNSDFSAGNVGFTSGQFYTSSYAPCNYYVNNTFFTLIDPTLIDHTPTADNMFMAIDGCTAVTTLWSQTILGLDPNTNYAFKFWASRADQVQPDFEIHLIGDVTGDFLAGTQAGIPYTGLWTWDEYGVASWNSGANTSVTLLIVNQEVNGWGDDFGMDDFSFRKACEASAVVRVTVIGTPTAPLDLGPDIALCASGTHAFDAGAGFMEYLWNDGSTGQTYTAYGIGTYWVTVTDSCGGTMTDTVHITLAPPPTLDLGADFSVCSNATAQLGYIGNTTFTSFLWTPATGLSCTTCPAPIVTGTVPILYFLVASTAEGCTVKDSVQVSIDQSQSIQLTLDVRDANCLQGGVVEVHAVSTTSDLILVDFNHQGSSTDTVFPGLPGGVYELTVHVGESDCPLDTVVEVAGEDYTVYIPNSYTPNNDAINDLWYIHGNCIATLECRIYNRWGELVGLLDEPDEGWDGLYKGQKVPDGIYTYVAYVTFGIGDPYQATGFVTVLR